MGLVALALLALFALASPLTRPDVTALIEEAGGSLPQFVCPITHELLVDPVCTVDGHIYERAAIEHWLTQHATSPLTGIELQSTQLIPQHSLRSLVAEWRASHT